MEIKIEKIPGGLNIDGIEIKGGKCGCTSILPCCHSWSKVKRSGNIIAYTGKTTTPETEDNFNWGYIVKKGDITVDVKMEDARDKTIFSGFYPPKIEEWVEKGWAVVSKEGDREDFDIWRCAACKWLYKNQKEAVKFEELPSDWRCPVCKAGKDVFERVG